MIEIIYRDKKKRLEFKDWQDGYYLVRRHINGALVIIAVANKFAVFLDGLDCPGFNTQDSMPDFYDHYEVVGKINKFTVTSIELEKE